MGSYVVEVALTRYAICEEVHIALVQPQLSA